MTVAHFRDTVFKTLRDAGITDPVEQKEVILLAADKLTERAATTKAPINGSAVFAVAPAHTSHEDPNQFENTIAP